METRGVAATATHPASVFNRTSNEFIYRNMALFFSSCWSIIATSLIWVCSFIATHLIRFRKGNSSQVHVLKASLIDDSRRAEPCPGVTNSYTAMRYDSSFEEEEPPRLSFKFQYQLSGHLQFGEEGLQNPDVEEKKPSMNTSIHNYRFLLEKGVCGFMEEPEAKTCRIQESYVDPETKLHTSFVSSKDCHLLPSAKAATADKLQTVNKLQGIWDEKVSESSEHENPKSPETKLSGEFERTVQAKVLLEEFSGFDEQGVSRDEKFPTVERLGQLKLTSHERTTRAKFVSEVFWGFGKLDGIRDEKFPGVELLKQEKPLSPQMNLSGEFKRSVQAKFLSEEFSGFDSDTESSRSTTDGYLVKELVVDSDSDCLLSEYEHEADARKASIDAGRYKEKLLADIRRLEEAQLQFTHDYDTEAASAIGKFSIRNISLDKSSPENESDRSDPEQKGLSQGEAESNQFHKFEESKLPILRYLQTESTDSSQDELKATVKQSSPRKSSDDVVPSNDLPNRTYEDLNEKEVRKDTDVDSADSIDSIISRDSEFSSGFNVSHDGLLGQIREQEDAQLMAELDELAREEELEREEKAPNKSKEKRETRLEDLDDEDYDELESLWEHQDLIEQLKMELKRVRAIGLPTIKEESETPKTVDDLKPWKIDEKFLHDDPMDELHKFYKSYRERMRKLDILNYQKMYAIGLLQLEDPLQSMGSQKSLVPTITSIISQSFWSCSRKFGINPSEKFIKELQNELEMVYVGQTCLSWEFLCWQFEKARKLQESDPYQSNQYNKVAREFQQFQVLLQRFIEDEAFQGPRLPNYVKNRCGVQNLLIVPVIREDSLKEKMEDQRKGNYIVTSEILEDIMEEAVRIFWEFVKVDKDETLGILKGLIGPHVELQDPKDFQFMSDIQSNLQKKEKKLKDIIRTGNCLVKKFKKPKEDRSNQHLFSQVDLKLVARVLRMSRITTDQLVWCHAKLTNITFIDRKVHREPSFLLFPC